MEYTNLGNTGLEVSRLCMGCLNFGTEQPWMLHDVEEAQEVIDRALELGINFFDTANAYSGGESEEILGEAVAERDREELVLATKVYFPMREGPNGGGLSRKHVLDQAHASLDRLDTDYIDLYQIHRWDENTPIAETLSALDRLVEEGVVRYVGASTMPAWKLMKALHEADVNNYERFVSMQCEYNLVDRHEEANVLPLCADQNLGVIPWSPLAGGFLTGKYERGEDPDEGRAATDEFMEKRFTDENWAVLDVVEELAEEKDATEAQVSLAWLLHKELVDAPIVGPRTVEHLEDNVGALDVELTDEEMERLEEPITPVWNPDIGDV
ncbi:aldo/keto reductase [Halopelagius longus]|uniref:Aldo/keto reductase n=1 Tax=Halopelagius longus TaxID=1236180 RepID=A0A1H0Y4B1_9EURY|nr:aldo/keto reductase [Halopelagius longus]RDI72267.1 aldo/keto reductase [Halopelagius longus]SDQ09978.1 Predicted oxidoreductase [Halopelagius longus]